MKIIKQINNAKVYEYKDALIVVGNKENETWYECQYKCVAIISGEINYFFGNSEENVLEQCMEEVDNY